MLTFVSRQLWPQFLALAAYAPRRLVLLHSADKSESAEPARRLREFAIEVQGMAPESVETVEVSSANVEQLREAVGAVAERLELDESNCVFNLTGGNKLMTMAGSGGAGTPAARVSTSRPTTGCSSSSTRAATSGKATHATWRVRWPTRPLHGTPPRLSATNWGPPRWWTLASC